MTLTVVREGAMVGHGGEAWTPHKTHKRRPRQTRAMAAMRWCTLVRFTTHTEASASKGQRVGGGSTRWYPFRSPGRKGLPPGGRGRTTSNSAVKVREVQPKTDGQVQKSGRCQVSVPQAHAVSVERLGCLKAQFQEL